MYDENLNESLILANNTNIITEKSFKQLLQNVFAVLVGNSEPHNITNLSGSKPDAIKELYAALLSLTSNFVRTNQTKETVTNLLVNRCQFNPGKVEAFIELYELHKVDIEAGLINIGTYLPHVTDISWKIDYIIKSSSLDKNDGPIFRIGFKTEKSNNNGGKSVEYVNFSCTSQELQDLVYKIKDAVRFCQKIANEH